MVRITEFGDNRRTIPFHSDTLFSALTQASVAPIRWTYYYLFLFIKFLFILVSFIKIGIDLLELGVSSYTYAQ